MPKTKNHFVYFRLKTAILLALVLMVFSGCASFQHGSTQREADNQYMIVDAATKSFGYKRMQYNLGHNSTSLKGFVRMHGMPDFIYEYSLTSMKNAIRMYYVGENKVYTYEPKSWLADSLDLKETRELTDEEKGIHKMLLRNMGLSI